MMRQSSSRNQRSKGLRLKNILQICLLAAVFFWLLYQLKHTYAKKGLGEHNASDLNNVEESQSEFTKLGRKGLPHDKVMDSDDKTHKKEGENEDVDEDEDGESQQAVEDDEAKVTGDDGIDDQDNEQEDEQDDQERGDEEAEDGEGAANEEENDNQIEEAGFLEDQESEDGSSQEKHEKSYKKDDASSAVHQENQVETEGNSVDEEPLQNNVKDLETEGGSGRGTNSPKDNNNTSIIITGAIANDTNQNNSQNANGALIVKIRPQLSAPDSQSKLQTNSTIASASDKQVNAQTDFVTDATINETVGKTNAASHENGTPSRSSGDDPNTPITLGSLEEDKLNMKRKTEEAANKSAAIIGQEKLDELPSTSLTLNDSVDAVEGDSTGSSHRMAIEEVRDAHIDLSTLPDMRNDMKNMDDDAAE